VRVDTIDNTGIVHWVGATGGLHNFENHLAGTEPMAAIRIPAEESKTPPVKHKLVFERNGPPPTGGEPQLMTIKFDFS
jgi:hypothetical protein